MRIGARDSGLVLRRKPAASHSHAAVKPVSPASPDFHFLTCRHPAAPRPNRRHDRSRPSQATHCGRSLSRLRRAAGVHTPTLPRTSSDLHTLNQPRDRTRPGSDLSRYRTHHTRRNHMSIAFEPAESRWPAPRVRPRPAHLRSLALRTARDRWRYLSTGKWSAGRAEHSPTHAGEERPRRTSLGRSVGHEVPPSRRRSRRQRPPGDTTRPLDVESGVCRPERPTQRVAANSAPVTSRSTRHHVATVHVCQISSEVAEVSGRVITGRRSRALAARLEFLQSRWTCTELVFGSAPSPVVAAGFVGCV